MLPLIIARNITKDLLNHDSKLILKVRIKNPNATISEFTAKMFTDILPHIPLELLQKLLRKFNN